MDLFDDLCVCGGLCEFFVVLGPDIAVGSGEDANARVFLKGIVIDMLDLATDIACKME